MRRHASGAAYQNYTDATLTDWRTAYYGSAADRLTRLKKPLRPHAAVRLPAGAVTRALATERTRSAAAGRPVVLHGACPSGPIPRQAARSFSLPPPRCPARLGDPGAPPRLGRGRRRAAHRTSRADPLDPAMAVVSGVSSAIASGASSSATAVPSANPPITSVG